MVAAAIVGGAVIGGVASNAAAKKGAKASGDAGDLQYEQYQQQRDDQEPWRQAGMVALRQLTGGIGGDYTAEKSGQNFDQAAYLAANPDVASDPYFSQHAFDHFKEYGQNEGRQFTYTPEAAALNTKGADSTGVAGDFNRDFTLADFQKDPGYDFRLKQGTDAVQGSAAARGSMLSGATLKALSNYGSDYASAEYGKAYDRFNNDRTQRFNRLATVAGIGQTATNNVGTAGANYATQAGNNMIGGANASASGLVGGANAVNGGISNLQSLYMLNNSSGGGYKPGGNSGGYYESDGAGGSTYIP